MDQVAAILIGAAIGVVVVGAAVAATRFTGSALRDVRMLAKSIQKMNELLAALAESNAAMTASIQKMDAHVTEMNGYITGFVKVCESMVAQFEKVSGSVDNLCNLIAPKEDGGDSFAPYSEETADLVFRKQSFMAQGYTEAEALALAKADEKASLLYNPDL